MTPAVLLAVLSVAAPCLPQPGEPVDPACVRPGPRDSSLLTPEELARMRSTVFPPTVQVTPWPRGFKPRRSSE